VLATPRFHGKTLKDAIAMALRGECADREGGEYQGGVREREQDRSEPIGQ
jgi:hypothetical protein